jgi:hypothetical protein
MTRINGFIDSFAALAGWQQHGGIWSGVSTGDTIIQSSGLLALSGVNFRLEIFGGSGVLTYRGGPYEGLHLKEVWEGPSTAGPAGDGFWPIMHSGHFEEGATLNRAYARGQNVVLIDSSVGRTNGSTPQITFIVANRKFTHSTKYTQFPVSFSGLYRFPGLAGNDDVGDFGIFTHSAVAPGSISNPNSADEARARSLGPGAICFSTGSGFINTMTGSGIAMYCGGFEKVQTPLNIVGRQRVPLQTTLIPDLMMANDGQFSGVRFFVPGLYLVDYCIGLEKTAGTTARTMAAWGIIVPKGLEAQFPVPSPMPTAISGSISYGIVTNTTASTNTSLSNRFLVNADAGDFLALEVVTTRAGPAGQDVAILGSGTRCIIQYIGPRRSDTNSKGQFGGI